ncbi:stage V sporulation protein K-like [Telopea speciosissima]|uniref:stage V sporulation protein K-like n=1 Tax=Telopea speciosissima TaxID=54955 RepID=UPI001CC44A94|nr:stage V sporulation protein K-like [Telopea speciosissima]
MPRRRRKETSKSKEELPEPTDQSPEPTNILGLRPRNLVGLKKKLEENPDIVNDINNDGETPLHTAAKNGCNEVARFLLLHGASVAAKDNKGVTPLHLAVLYSQKAGDCLIVRTLLDYNADCNVEDNDGRSPLNHLSEGPERKYLSEILHNHLGKQRKRKANELCSEMKAKMDELENELSKIVGLHELKVQLRKWMKGMVLDKKRRALGIQVSTPKAPHMAFLGNPGTGKTKVARILGKLFHTLGILPTDKVKEVQRTDLVGEYIGQTGPKTKKVIREAEGGILFVDEAYRLIPVPCQRTKDFGLEALEEIMSVMDSGKIVTIFAGYTKPMKGLISSNEGLYRRVTKFFSFHDFSCEELAQILHLKMNNQPVSSSLFGFKLDPECTLEVVAELIEIETTVMQRQKMNGGLVDLMLVNAKENLDFRLDFDSSDEDDLRTFILEDLEVGLKSLSQLDFLA